MAALREVFSRQIAVRGTLRTPCGEEEATPGVKLLSSIKRSEIRPVIGNERIVAVANLGHQFPILVAAESQEVHVITDIALAVGHRHERAVKTLIDQELH
jgi:hypothetical protein